jgi:hypothetical protein
VAVAGNTVRTVYLYLDINDAPLTGQTTPANITFVLMRDSGSGMVPAGETITFSETATAGYYNLYFTPVNTGLYTLFCKELAGGQRQPRFDFQVLAAGSIFSPSYANAFCAETDIERWLNQSIDSASKPSDAATTAFAESRGAQLMGLCARLGYPVTPLTVTSGSALEDMLRDANAIGAALDYRAAQAFGSGTTKNTDSIEWFQDQWDRYVGHFEGAVWIAGTIASLITGSLVSLATDHIISGDTQAAPSSGAPADAGIQITMGDVF